VKVDGGDVGAVVAKCFSTRALASGLDSVGHEHVVEESGEELDLASGDMGS